MIDMTPRLMRPKVAQYISSRDYINEYACPACGEAVCATSYHARKGKIRCRSCRPKDQHKTSRDPRYMVWTGMKQRCNNPNSRSYPGYGGRGIKVCEEWQKFSGFMQWTEFPKYERGLQIDRIDNDGDYSPDNCRWVAPSVNARNRGYCKVTHGDVRAIRMLAWSGVGHSDIAKIFGVSKSEISHVMTFRIWGDI